MNKPSIHRLFAVALFAAGCAGSAFAVTPGAASTDVTKVPTPSASMKQGSDYGNPADANKVEPSREQVQRDATMPSTRTLDDNAQRQHDRDNAARPDSSGNKDSGGNTNAEPTSPAQRQ